MSCGPARGMNSVSARSNAHSGRKCGPVSGPVPTAARASFEPMRSEGTSSYPCIRVLRCPVLRFLKQLYVQIVVRPDPVNRKIISRMVRAYSVVRLGCAVRCRNQAVAVVGRCSVATSIVIERFFRQPVSLRMTFWSCWPG